MIDEGVNMYRRAGSCECLAWRYSSGCNAKSITQRIFSINGWNASMIGTHIFMRS